MKKLLSLLLALALVFSLASCGQPQKLEAEAAGDSVTVRDQEDSPADSAGADITEDNPEQPDKTETTDGSQAEIPDADDAEVVPEQSAPASKPTTPPASKPTEPESTTEATTEATEETTEETTEATEETSKVTEETTEATEEATEATEETTEATEESTEATEEPESSGGTYGYTSKEDVALYIHTYGCLPPNFITKSQARALGWRSGSLEPYAPGKCIGGDRFYNREGLLPDAPGRYYYECDIDTLGASSRGAKRIVYSNDGLIYYTSDHYASFTLLYGEP